MADARRAAVGSGALLFAVYLATLAPGVTLWDAGEFLAAVRTLGIPHPPGTPLFILVARAWSSLFPDPWFAAVVNAASAVATAMACALLAWLVSRWTRSALAGGAAGVTAGTMTAVWQSATETEVYAYSLLLVVVMLVVADRAGLTWSGRHRLLLAYLFGLAVPLHISALVAAPAVLYLSATDAGGVLSWRATLLPAGAFLIAVGLGTVSPVPAVAGAALLVSSSLLSSPASGRGVSRASAAALLAVLGASAVLFMLVRARWDPGINQGDPSTWASLLEVVGRRQYDVPPLWPRRAPLWLQVGNVVQYADWQVASALSSAPGASWARTPFTVLFVLLGIAGSRWHRGRDRRSWSALLVLLGAASLGVVLVLNLRAGPSYGWGVLPAGAIREARERDYFFALAFAIWGVWAACGAAAAAAATSRRWGKAFLVLALLPLALNWRAVDRRRGPDVRLAQVLGEALLHAVPPRAVLVLAGDNDSYAVWFAQHAQQRRLDVAPVTVPLLGARWYRAELRRRHALLEPRFVDEWLGVEATLGALAAGAARAGRPVAAAVSLLPSQRLALAPAWVFEGMVYMPARDAGAPAVSVDTGRVRDAAEVIDSLTGGRSRGEAGDPAGRYVQALLRCPAAALRSGEEDARRLLETSCNYR